MSQARHERRAPYIGRWMPRFEDFRLITGQGRYADDISYPDQSYAIFVRSPHPHARHRAASMARPRSAMPGVIAVLTAADFAASGAKGVQQDANPADVVDWKIKAFGHDGRKPFELAASAVRAATRCAMSASRSRWWWRRRVAQARDAAEAVVGRLRGAARRRRRDRRRSSPARRSCSMRRRATSRSKPSSATARRSRPPSPRRISSSSIRFAATRAVAAQMEPRAMIGALRQGAATRSPSSPAARARCA